ncbi:hypothetical protein TYRP_004058 [Tyrophagus putrescentiae]|nr:hypothetical protein TYRP_004058 [Tyrophagus putrescentiae]
MAGKAKSRLVLTGPVHQVGQLDVEVEHHKARVVVGRSGEGGVAGPLEVPPQRLRVPAVAEAVAGVAVVEEDLIWAEGDVHLDGVGAPGEAAGRLRDGVAHVGDVVEGALIAIGEDFIGARIQFCGGGGNEVLSLEGNFRSKAISFHLPSAGPEAETRNAIKLKQLHTTSSPLLFST